MTPLFLAHGSTDHEDCPPRLFRTPRELAEYILDTANDMGEIITDCHDNDMVPSVTALEKHLLNGRSLYIGKNTILEVGCAITPDRPENADCPVYRFTQCNSLEIDGSFIGRIENEAPEAIDAYLGATTEAEKLTVLSEFGEHVVFNWCDEDGNTVLDFSLAQLAQAQPKPNSRDMIMTVNDGNGNEDSAIVTFYRTETL